MDTQKVTNNPETEIQQMEKIVRETEAEKSEWEKDLQAGRIMSSIAAGSVVYLIGWASYGDVAPEWLLLATLGFSILVGVIVYFVNPDWLGIQD